VLAEPDLGSSVLMGLNYSGFMDALRSAAEVLDLEINCGQVEGSAPTSARGMMGLNPCHDPLKFQGYGPHYCAMCNKFHCAGSR